MWQQQAIQQRSCRRGGGVRPSVPEKVRAAEESQCQKSVLIHTKASYAKTPPPKKAKPESFGKQQLHNLSVALSISNETEDTPRLGQAHNSLTNPLHYKLGQPKPDPHQHSFNSFL